MFRFRKATLAAALFALSSAGVWAATDYAGIGRGATPKEIAAWNIDVRPDFQGLPKGSGTVDKGQDIWEARCASCHGFFGESGEVFNPIIGGIQPKDMETGHVANLTGGYPGRTTFMKVPTLSTVFDFINRAMPWNEPKSLKPDEVYSVLAFLLNLSTIIPADFVLDQDSIKEVQKRMPNRNGMDTKHALWPGKEFGGVDKPDTSNTACMKDCIKGEIKVASELPDFARNAHGNLAEQVRAVGEAAGADTTKPELKKGERAVAPAAAPKAEEKSGSADSVKPDAKAATAALNKNGCLVCHGMDKKIVGPAYTDVAKKYPGKADYLVGKIKSGGVGLWGEIPMPPQNVSDKDAKTIAAWLAAGGGK
jgi:cytochrome c